MKTDDDRLNDTKNYLSHHITPAQYNEVMSKYGSAPNKQGIGAALSIGNKNPLNTASRRAKRSLMLLATLFINDQTKRTAEVTRLKNLPEGAEAPLIAEIKSWFTLPGVTQDLVAVNAKNNIGKMPKWNNVNYEAADAVRGVYHANKPFNCYNACVFWAFQAGAISKRYLWNELQGTDGNGFFPTYSRVGWTLEDTSGTAPIIIPAGRTVYFETPTKVFGHVACSLGDGSVISQNSVNIGDTALNRLTGRLKDEFEKMANAITHIVPIRDMLTQYFNPTNGYPRLKILNGPFWDPIPVGER